MEQNTNNQESLSPENSEQEIVNKVADLVEKFFYVQNISGQGDDIPYRISKALKDGYIKCYRCMGDGIDVHNRKCYLCEGTGKVNYTINRSFL